MECALRVRAVVDGRQKATRTVTHTTPKWRQNLLFTMKNVSLEKLSSQMLTVKLTRPTRIGETVLGEFSCYLSAIVHSNDRSIIAKWVALAQPGDDDDQDDYAFENCGFLKVSMCIYRIDESPPQLVDDDGTEEIWSGAHLSYYTLKIRLFCLISISDHIIQATNKTRLKKNKNKNMFYIAVSCGDEKTESSLEQMIDGDGEEVVPFEQELYLPIQWPTVISKISLMLYMKRGRKKRIIGQASIPLRLIYEPGETGFMPTFGPVFLNFFGDERLLSLKWLKENNPMSTEDGSRFIGRLLVAVDCVEYMGESSAQKSFLDHSSIRQAQQFGSAQGNYVLCCSMQMCNMINPLFSSNSIQFYVSIGNYGSTGVEQRTNATSALGALPNTDGCKYFSMPWGNMRPLIELPCIFENVEFRIERTNSLMKIVNMLDSMLAAAHRVGTSARNPVASIGMEALDSLERMVLQLLDHHDANLLNTNLDKNWQLVRKKNLLKLKSQIEGMCYEADYTIEEMVANVIRMITRMRQIAMDIANDVQISLPPILVKMMGNGRLIGFVKIPVWEVFQSDSDAMTGEWCGRVRAINLRWPAMFDRKSRREEFPAVLHMKLWFGTKADVPKWTELVQPGEPKRYIELFQTQSRSVVKGWSGKGYTDEIGNEVEDISKGLPGWRFEGRWILKNSHDMWVSEVCGKPTIYDKAYEMEKLKSGKWVFTEFTDFFGSNISTDKPIPGWEYARWVVDKHRNNGDKNGWVYSTRGQFWNSLDVEREAKPFHKYRRRCIRRARRLLEYKKEHENLNAFQESLEEAKWEFSQRRAGPFHDLEEREDKHKRRRFLMEVEPDKRATDNEIDEVLHLYRLYEAHPLTSTWQLRCYIMWAKDLLPIVKNSSRALVRVFFAHHAMQTILVDNSQNPIWNETVIFKSVPIPGGTRDISQFPPVVYVEVRGERHNDTEVHLGRFEVMPTVICLGSDARAKPHWYPLKFYKGNTRGSVLACFEMFQVGITNDQLPLEPARKKQYDTRYDIPSELRPHFDKYSVLFLCWGVRNLSKYQMLSVKKPFVEVTIGDQEFAVEALKDVRKNPNFPEPVITFPEVALPSALELSPPMVVNLYDSRAFRRTPLIGVCLITDIHKYVRPRLIKKEDGSNTSWDDFDNHLEDEKTKLLKTLRIKTLREEGMPRLDWWSRYYCSLGQEQKGPGYVESGMEFIRVFKRPLEEVNGYNNFGDFLNTFNFVKSAKGDFDDPEEKEKTGELKARLIISKIGKNKKEEPLDPPGVHFIGPVQCVVRVYVVEATGLVTNRKNGVVDPYIVARCGGQKVNLKKRYIADSVDPIFGERIDMVVTIPVEKDLIVTIMDKRRLLADEEIGTTKIDLENRLLTKWRATSGLSTQYTIQGEQQWRDQLTPLETLKRYCIERQISAPKVLTREVPDKGLEYGLDILDAKFWYSDVIKKLESQEKQVCNDQRETAGKDKSGPREVSDKKNREAARPVNVEEMNYSEKSDKSKRLAQWEEVEAERMGAAQSKSRRVGQKTKENTMEAALAELRNSKRRVIIGTQLETVALYVLHQMNLVPEHIETRPLFAAMSGPIECGKLRLFVDVFPTELGPIPAPLDISPRKPDKYQLRIAVQNVTEAIPIKRSFHDPVSDLYVKVFVNGMLKGETTDVHFRILDGNGEFNWRFLLNVDYNPWEKKIVGYSKTRRFRKAREELVDPLFVVQLWDKNKLSKDKMLGEMELDLNNFFEGIDDPSDLGFFLKKKKRKVPCRKCCSKKCCCIACCIFCYETKCLCGIRKNKKIPFPKPKKYTDEPFESFSLFETQNICGWWPMLTSVYPHEETNAKKKDDDVAENQKWIMGLVQMDISLVTAEESELNPLGRKRKEPNHSPYLGKPKRSNWDSFWFTSRIRPCLRWFWHQWGLQILLWILIILVVVLLLHSLFNNWPFIVMHLFGFR